jgi:hypothetical protein
LLSQFDICISKQPLVRNPMGQRTGAGGGVEIIGIAKALVATGVSQEVVVKV